jgi:hypothetical protein
MGDVLRTRDTHASHRANLRCLGLSVGIAIAALSLTACDGPKRADSEFTLHYETEGVWLIRDRRTTCEYIANGRNGGIVLRSDAYGNVTPNCAGSHGYAKDFPYGRRPDQANPTPRKEP